MFEKISAKVSTYFACGEAISLYRGRVPPRVAAAPLSRAGAALQNRALVL